jgi:hypothetical protein
MQQSGTNWYTNMIPIRLLDWCRYLANIGYQLGCLIGIRLEESVANQSPIRWPIGDRLVTDWWLIWQYSTCEQFIISVFFFLILFYFCLKLSLTSTNLYIILYIESILRTYFFFFVFSFLPYNIKHFFFMLHIFFFNCIIYLLLFFIIFLHFFSILLLLNLNFMLSLIIKNFLQFYICYLFQLIMLYCNYLQK